MLFKGIWNNKTLNPTQAYRKWVREHWEEPRLPGTLLSNEQVFFISFARVSR